MPTTLAQSRAKVEFFTSDAQPLAKWPKAAVIVRDNALRVVVDRKDVATGAVASVTAEGRNRWRVHMQDGSYYTVTRAKGG